MAEPLIIRLNGTKKQRELFLDLLPILKNKQEVGKTCTMGEIDFEQVYFYYHCAKKYGISKPNNRVNKKMATIEATKLRDEGKSLQQIADSLNERGYKTSRDKSFHRAQVKRLLDEVDKKEE